MPKGMAGVALGPTPPLVKGPHIEGSKLAIDREASGSETRPNRAKTGLGRLAQAGQPGLFRARFAPSFCPRCSPIYCLCLHRLQHPSNHQRAADTKKKHREEADSRCKSSSCLGDGLGHALAAMVGPEW
jgi:hypothetical protein